LELAGQVLWKWQLRVIDKAYERELELVLVGE
jgi:hypothetical protein